MGYRIKFGARNFIAHAEVGHDVFSFCSTKGGRPSRVDADTSEEHYLRATWQALASGVHESANGSDRLSGFKGPANAAKSASQERSLIFKSADDWLAYN